MLSSLKNLFNNSFKNNKELCKNNNIINKKQIFNMNDDKINELVIKTTNLIIDNIKNIKNNNNVAYIILFSDWYNFIVGNNNYYEIDNHSEKLCCNLLSIKIENIIIKYLEANNFIYYENIHIDHNNLNTCSLNDVGCSHKYCNPSDYFYRHDVLIFYKSKNNKINYVLENKIENHLHFKNIINNPMDNCSYWNDKHPYLQTKFLHYFIPVTNKKILQYNNKTLHYDLNYTNSKDKIISFNDNNINNSDSNSNSNNHLNLIFNKSNNNSNYIEINLSNSYHNEQPPEYEYIECNEQPPEYDE